MTTLNITQIRDELCEVLRNGDVLSVSVRGVTTTTDNFTATASQTIFNLNHIGVKNIRSLTVNSVAQKYITDYIYVGSTGVVTLNTGVPVGQTVSIQYDYSSTGDKIYPDMPRNVLTLTSYPRIGLETTSLRTEMFGLGGMSHLSDFLITIYAIVPANKDSSIAGGLGGTNDLSNILNNIRNVIRTNAKSFSMFKYITPIGSSPIIKGDYDKLIQQSIDFNIKFIFE